MDDAAPVATASATAEADVISLYWVQGCGNCTRLKGHLGARGIPYRAINVMEDLQAFEDMKKAGLATIPAIRRGDEWVNGFDLKRVDAFLGISKAAQDAGQPAVALGSGELCARAANILETAAAAAALWPLEHHDDPTPTMENFTAPVLFMADGAPYIPHGTNRSLAIHLLGHAVKLRRLALAHDGSHEVGFEMAMEGEAAAFGEPDLYTPLYRVLRQIEIEAGDIRAWGKAHPDADLSRERKTHYGIQTFRQLMQTMLCSIAQHSRQVLQRTEELGLTPPARIAEADLAGLQMPAGVWS